MAATVININENEQFYGLGKYTLPNEYTGVILGWELLVDPKDPNKVRCMPTDSGLKPVGWAANVLDPETGRITQGRWGGYWLNGQPTPDNPSNVGLFRRFDERIDLAKCKREKISLHIYRDAQGRQQVEFAK